MYTEFTNITDYLDCKYELELNDKIIGKFYGHHDFKKLVTSYIRSRVSELIEKQILENDNNIIYSIRVRDTEFLNKKVELREKGTPYNIPSYVNAGKYVRSIKKYMGKNIFQLIDLLSITIRE